MTTPDTVARGQRVPDPRPAPAPAHGRRQPSATALRSRTRIPTILAPAIGRPRIEEMLDAGTRRRLTLVSAGPGWGKTTTTALWARRQHPFRVAWLTCEPQDDAPAQFWALVIAALCASGAVPPGHPLRWRHFPADITAEFQRQLLRDVESLPEPVVLVLDEFAVLANSGVLAIVDDILRYPLPLHLVILARTDPVLTLHTLRVRAEVREIVADDLTFDAAEVAALGARHGQPLAARDVDQVLAKTGGWAVGVRLLVSSPPGSAGRARNAQSAAEFLAAEVLDRQEPRMRRFLLRTSVTTSVCADLAVALDPGDPVGPQSAADHLTTHLTRGAAQRMLSDLGAHNGFVTAFDADGTWYRYHPLLREMLQSTFRLEDPQAERAAHRAAARWLAEHGEPIQALDHAASCEDWALFGKIFVSAAATCLFSGQRDALVETLSRLRFAELTMDAALHLCAGSLALATGRHLAARDHIDRARELLPDHQDEPVTAALVEVLDAMCAQAQGDVRRLAALGGAALAALDRVPFPFPALDAYRAEASAQRVAGLAWCGVPQFRGGHDVAARAAVSLTMVATGELDRGEQMARGILSDASARGATSDVHIRPAYAALAWSTLLRGQFEDAERLLAQGLAADSNGPDPASEVAIRLLQALSAAARGHPTAAHLALAEADRALPPRHTPPLLTDLRLRASTEKALADQQPGRIAPGSGSVGPQQRPEPSPGVAAIARARLALAAGRVGAAQRVLAGVTSLDPWTAIEATLVEANALAAAGTSRARELADRALDMAGAHRLVLPFLTVPTASLKPVLARCVHGRQGALAALLRSVLPQGQAAAEPVPLIERLTERELAILAALSTMKSNMEIAEDFFVSVNTVKAHLKSLYRKLGTGSRRDAVRRGRELGLLPR